jgi:pimeloyl-ACP methyl ester carboxylesterase
MTSRLTGAVILGALTVTCAVAAPEVVILKDGFVVQGNPRREVTQVHDKASGASIPIVKNTGYDMIDEGAKVTIFSVHARQPGGVAPDTKLRPDSKAYTQRYNGSKSAHDLPVGGTTSKISEFNEKWLRSVIISNVPNSPPVAIEQQIVFMDPYWILMVSPTHKWRLTFRTTEWEPRQIRKLLMTHPDLAEPDGKCDPLKRVALAKFMLDAGWLQYAKDEVDRLARDHPGELSSDAKVEHEKLLREIDTNTAERYAREAELSLAAGRYKYTVDLLKEFPEKTAGPREVARVAKVNADLKIGQERYDTARRLLRGVIDDVTGMRAINARVAVGGGLAAATWVAPKEAPGQTLDLAAAAERVLAELHQDSAIRIETFVTLAAQAQRERAAGREPTKKPAELLATVVSGWVRGKNGATPDPDAAWKLWTTREAVLAYQRAETMNERTAVLGRYKKNITLGVDEIAQLISLLPPAAPEDLLNRTGKEIPLGKLRETGIYRRTTLPAPGNAVGIDYLVKLPPEYHHGRAYPVLIALAPPGANSEEMLAPLIAEADRYGYIVIVPEWAGMFGQGWAWKGEDHIYVTAALRDTIRHFTVDNDRVFMIGLGEGANMAMDVGMSHPDLFAGVIPINPAPKWGVFMYYWQNAQKVPFYTVIGEGAGEALQNLKRIYDNWMPYGFPAMMTLYKGRGNEWFPAETPVFFDWMSLKKRAKGVSTLAGLSDRRKPWVTWRETDNHFYWLQVDGISERNLYKPNGYPAEIQGNIRGDNTVDVSCRGVTKLTIWLSNDLGIDWSKPVNVLVNRGTPLGFKKKVLEPNLEILLEDYYQRGDRRMLFLNKIECPAIP